MSIKVSSRQLVKMPAGIGSTSSSMKADKTNPFGKATKPNLKVTKPRTHMAEQDNPFGRRYRLKKAKDGKIVAKRR